MRLIKYLVLILLFSSIICLMYGCEEEANQNQKITQKEAQAISSKSVQPEKPVKPLKRVEKLTPLRPQTQKPMTKKPDEKAPQNGTPKIEVENPVHDFGVIGPGKKYSCKFNFKNIGDSTLNISKVQSTCSCSVARLTKKAYEPGESGSVEVTYTSQSREGVVTKTLYIMSNDPQNSRAEIKLKAKVEPKVEVSPKRFELRLNEDNAGIPDIILTSKDGQPFAVTSFNSTRKAITAEFDPNESKDKIVLKPKVDLEKLKLSLNGTISIQVTHPLANNVSISYSTKPLFELSGSGRTIILKNASPGQTETREVWIKSNYGDEVEIESITSQKNYLEVLKQEKRDKQVKLTIKVTTPERTSSSTRFFTDELIINVKDSVPLKIRCSGWYKTTTNR